MAATPFLVICPNTEDVFTANKPGERPHFFIKKKVKKLFSRFGPADWEAESAGEKMLWLAMAGLALIGIGFGLSILLELETPVFFLYFAVTASILGIIAIARSRKSQQPMRAFTTWFGWFTIVITGLVAFVADIF